MRFVRARTADGPRLGVLQDDGVVLLSSFEGDLAAHYGDDGTRLRELGELIARSPAGEHQLAELDLLAPVEPTSMRDFMAFEEHVLPSWRAAGLTRGPDIWYRQPIGYFSNVATLRGPRDPIEIPGGTSKLDFELEVAAVLGRPAKSVTPEQAGELIAGYLVLCDWSARDVQAAEMDGRLGPFKGKDFGSSLGSVFVTPDELGDRRSGSGYDLRMTSQVNNRRYGTDVWSSAYWSFDELVSYASWNSVVEQGALIGSGTCQGGCILELSTRHSPQEYPWLADGDQVVLSIELLGDIRAQVVAATRDAWPGYRQTHVES